MAGFEEIIANTELSRQSLDRGTALNIDSYEHMQAVKGILSGEADAAIDALRAIIMGKAKGEIDVAVATEDRAYGEFVESQAAFRRASDGSRMPIVDQNHGLFVNLVEAGNVLPKTAIVIARQLAKAVQELESVRALLVDAGDRAVKAHADNMVPNVASVLGDNIDIFKSRL